MNTQPPLLPETKFRPLSDKKLEAMIAHAITHPQLQPQAKVTNLAVWRRNLAFGGTMAAMAASILLAFAITPQITVTGTSGASNAYSQAADVSDLLLLDSLES